MTATIENARQLLQAGEWAAAERAFEAVLEQAPGDVEALNFVALAALRAGRVDRAMDLVQEAVRVAPADPVTQFHLGKVLEAREAVREAAQAYGRAVASRPDFYVARLAYATALESVGRADEALLQYARCLKDAQREGRWIDAATTPAPLRPRVEHAVRTFRAGRRHLYARLIEPLRVRFGAEALQRFDKCLRIYLREDAPDRPDPRQQPSFLFFPDLPTAPYIDRAALPWVPQFEAQADAIRAELLTVVESAEGRERVFADPELERRNLRGSTRTPAWNGYYFWRHGERREDNCTRCPATAAVLEAVPLARVRGHAPEVLFSVFTPGTHLLPHRGVTNTRIVVHLPLIVPADCALNVGGELHVWREGQVVAFDDTYEHEAWNRSDAVRIVLILDVWNPYLTDVERLAVADLVGAIGDLRAAIAGA